MLPHLAAPIDITGTSLHVPDNGNLWIFNHKPLDRDHNQPDAYYPTEVERSANGSWIARSVFIGTAQDKGDIQYRITLYYCNSNDSIPIQEELVSKELRQRGLPAITGPSCKELDTVQVTRLGS